MYEMQAFEFVSFQLRHGVDWGFHLPLSTRYMGRYTG